VWGCARGCRPAGIPDSRPLAPGDLVNVDVTAFLDGYHGDTNATFMVGERVSDAARELVQVTRTCLDAAIDVCGPGVPFSEIGRTIEGIAGGAGMTVIRGFVGHGIGRCFHAAPPVLHHRNSRPDVMQRWQTFTIEPILTLGGAQDAAWPQDATGWTRVTGDGALAAQFEHTLMVTDDGVEVLTRLDE
jgi:methionyl aminopeptidase